LSLLFKPSYSDFYSFILTLKMP